MEVEIIGHAVDVNFVRLEDIVMVLINREMIELACWNNSRKISLMKALRVPYISKILIDAGYVDEDEIRHNEKGETFVGLAFAKNWIDANYKF